ncbi:very-long-chain 3-oxoacyl-CoA reductase 1-like [Triticum dicoccoides]|uniref:very-long-chain 3-oxoacyl-CoA reductase 1-like n=1 Tax=Triticum dicoccoides TaxID=85692 RepID=UPI001891465B|nr:very-long-chain 3-oxoacyl-CoA reductase 1-like [Triticum dicoccoides]
MMGGADTLLRQEPWFVSLAVLGALYTAAVVLRLLSHLALLLRRPRDLRRRYGAWAVVTGPTSGIGQSMALELARLGLNLVLVGRDPAKLQDISETISKTRSVQTKTVVFDLALVATPRGDEAVRRLREAVEGLDVGVLVNNAGVAKPCALYLHEVDVEAWVRMMRVNLCALTEVTAAVLPGMVQRGRGAVVNIGSGSSEAIPSFPLYTIYAASKRYVAQFSRSLYVEYRSKGIDVQCQAPLLVQTKMTSVVAGSGKRGRGLLQRLLVPTSEEYARAATRWIGHGPLCMPNLGHRLQWRLCRVVPGRLLDAQRLRENLRQRAVFQRLRSPRASSHANGGEQS